ncbi:hypothetical protein [Alkalilimnicola sp. S0819]|uniref:hypothetical protein n=1 Tax=Alkalilimnicola sp. S0819 TaxID=2613922 RepID=UPI001261665B|nr:hypothetical protein [Alkalilimnicola sp. S0819]KAB7624132.1 hypothetical protein F3N43_07015 [Alkalilimnicola sp. S0819]MPQ16385.1 hypothetical protein [Alkalilimnicola sp. S0819]
MKAPCNPYTALLLAACLASGGAAAQQRLAAPSVKPIQPATQTQKALQAAAKAAAMENLRANSDVVLQVPVNIMQADGYQQGRVFCQIGVDIAGRLAQQSSASESSDPLSASVAALGQAMAAATNPNHPVLGSAKEDFTVESGQYQGTVLLGVHVAKPQRRAEINSYDCAMSLRTTEGNWVTAPDLPQGQSNQYHASGPLPAL